MPDIILTKRSDIVSTRHTHITALTVNVENDRLDFVTWQANIETLLQSLSQTNQVETPKQNLKKMFLARNGFQMLHFQQNDSPDPLRHSNLQSLIQSIVIRH